MSQILRYLAQSYLARFAVTTVLCAGLLVLSLALVPPGGADTSIVWPSSALGLVILFFWGLDLWPALMAAFFVVLLARGVYPPLVVTTATANLFEAVVGVYILKYYSDFSPMLNRLRDTLGLTVAAVLASAVSATIITLGVFVFNNTYSFSSQLWVSVWIGHLVSLISFGPFALRWLCRPYFTKSRAEIMEGVVVFGTIIALCILLFWTPYASIGSVSLLYILIIPLIWAALRTGPRGTSLALIILATIGATGVLFGFGPIAHSADTREALFGIQMIIGTLSLIFLLFASITEERKEAVNRLESHVGRLETAVEKISSEDQAKAEFIAVLAHELRNPLSPLLSGLELLKIEEQGPPEVLKMMGAHLNTLARLLDDLLDMTRISQKKMQLKKEPVEIHALLSHVLEMARPHLDARQHTFVLSLPKEEVWLDGDPVRLAQIFVNLLSNSAKYTEPGGTIELTIQRQRDMLVASVKDNGIGIAPYRLNKIFDPFGGEHSEHGSQGLHIGLSLARRMAEMHGGSIQAQSLGEKKGAEMLVHLPLPATIPIAPATKQSRQRGRFFKKSAQATRPRALRILLVDDNEAATRAMGKLLEHYGHEVLLAYDAPEALTLAAEHRPDVAILDIGLPSMSGYQLAQAIRSASEHPLVCIALTGYGQMEDRQKAKEAGFDEHLVKPVSIVDIERVLTELRSK